MILHNIIHEYSIAASSSHLLYHHLGSIWNPTLGGGTVPTWTEGGGEMLRELEMEMDDWLPHLNKLLHEDRRVGKLRGTGGEAGSDAFAGWC